MSEEAVVRITDADWTSAVWRFWFKESPKEAWFKKDAAFDDRIRSRFAALVGDVHAASDETLLRGARETLSAIIVLDQFPRNIHRGSAAAFASDEKACSLARQAVWLGFDNLLSKDERTFFYLPFEHSEDIADQERSVALFGRLGDESVHDYALKHRAIVARFGRFPHRNAALGRTSTPEEVAFLATPGSSF